MTVRQIFYRAVSSGIVTKSEADYKNVVGRLLLLMRRRGDLPYSWVADNTRWMRKPASFDSVQDALAQTARTYRRNLWADQGALVEVWCEKDALAGVLYAVTADYDVPLMVSRGFASASFLFEAAEAIKEAARPAFIYYFGDHDPSGVSRVTSTPRASRVTAWRWTRSRRRGCASWCARASKNTLISTR
jgi:hypothetical protein